MRFTFASVLFVVVSVLFTILTAEAAAISRPQKLIRDVASPVVERAPVLDGHTVNVGPRRDHARDLRTAPRVVEERAASGHASESSGLNKRLHARDFRAIH
jgi:hypothetical protein